MKQHNHNKQTVSLSEVKPAKVAWFQHKLDQSWDQGQVVDMSRGLSDQTLRATVDPATKGEQWISGDMPHPESDDDTLLNSHLVGLRLNEDVENPQELNMAEDVAKAETHVRKSTNSKKGESK